MGNEREFSAARLMLGAAVQEKSGNIFEAIGNWFNDRKDDASHAADKAKDKVKK